MVQLVHLTTADWRGLPAVRTIDIQRPLQWLRLGWDDMRRLRWQSLPYGVFVAAAGTLLLALGWKAAYLVPAFIGGFLLVAPFVAIGLYALSSQLESGDAIDPRKALFAWRANAGSIALFGLMMAIGLILWERTAAIIFALSYGGTVPDLSHVLADVFGSGDYLRLAVAFVGGGALFALVAFTLSVVSAPMLLDRPVDVISAVLTSLHCCLRNPLPMRWRTHAFASTAASILAAWRARCCRCSPVAAARAPSTITQQLTRTMLLSQEKTFTRKAKEIMLARLMRAKQG